MGMDGLSSSIIRRAELFQQVADVGLQAATHSRNTDVKVSIFRSCKILKG
jgi:hypothetical protein